MVWSTVSTELSLFLDDATKTTVTEAMRIASFNRAQQYFAVTHTAQFIALPYTLDTLGQFSSPTGMIEPAAVHVYDPAKTTTRSLEKVTFYSSITAPTGGFYISGGKFTILDAIQPYSQITSGTLYYYGSYTDVATDASVIGLPDWAVWPVMNLTMAYTLYPLMMGQADIRRFQSKREAGAPEDNPSRIQAEFFINTYKSILAGFPIQDRGSGYLR